MEIQPHRRYESVVDFACVMTQAVLAIIVEAIGSDSYNNEICLRLFT